MMAVPVVHIVDDDPAVRDALGMLLDAAGQNVRSYCDADSFLTEGGAVAGPGCVDADHPDLYPEPITADAYLQERLREIKLA